MGLPELVRVEQSGDCVELTLYISGGLDCFRGHFDAAPIVPGVVQLQWAIDYCSHYLYPLSPLDIERVEALKFQQVIPPDTTVDLKLELTEGRLQFAITSNEVRHSSGRVVFS